MALENMKFLQANFIHGSSELDASSGTATLYNLIDRRPNTYWISVAEGTDTTASTITWTPSASYGTIDRLYIKKHNAKSFEVYYDGTESNTFTPAINVSNNASSNYYMEFGSMAVASVTLKLKTTITANQEKRVGELYFGTQYFQVENNPDEYNPILKKKGYDLEMSDGGVKSIWLANKFYGDLNFRYISVAEQAKFRSLYDNHESFVYMPTPEQGTMWDSNSWTVNWIGDYDAEKLTGGVSRETGFDINMSLWEVTG